MKNPIKQVKALKEGFDKAVMQPIDLPSDLKIGPGPINPKLNYMDPTESEWLPGETINEYNARVPFQFRKPFKATVSYRGKPL